MDKSTIQSILLEQWGGLGREDNAPIARKLDLSAQLSMPEISVVVGVRRCGKSSFLRRLARRLEHNNSVLWIDFDDPRLEGFHGKDLEAAVTIWREHRIDLKQRDGKRIFFLWDEIQNVVGWERWAAHYAKRSDTKVIVTGSNSKILSKELGTYLTGRHVTSELCPLSFREVVDYTRSSTESSSPSWSIEACYQQLFQFGGFPRAFLDRSRTLLPHYLNDIIERDLIARRGVRLTKPLKELARILCSDNTRLLNRTKIAAALGVKDDATIKRYCSYFEDVFLFFELKKFSPSLRKQQRSLAKYYCVDPVLARVNSFAISNNEGAFLENLVYLELRRRYSELFYWVSDEGFEVDFICRRPDDDPIAVQVSLTVADESTLARELRGLHAAADELQIKQLLLITKSDRSVNYLAGNGQVVSLNFFEWAMTK